MICNRACVDKKGIGRRVQGAQEPPTLNPAALRRAHPCLVSSDQSASIKPVSRDLSRRCCVKPRAR